VPCLQKVFGSYQELKVRSGPVDTYLPIDISNMIRFVLYSFIVDWLTCYAIVPLHGFQTTTSSTTRNGMKLREINHSNLKKQVLLVALIPPSDDNNELLFHSSLSSSESTNDQVFVASASASSTAASMSYFLTKEESHPIIRIGKNDENEKIINMFGVWCLFISLITGPLWMCAMYIVNVIYQFNNNNNDNTTFDPHRAIYDQTGKVWSKVWLSCINSYPTISGNNINKKNNSIGPCLYVANHSSWLDIPILCTVLDPVFKFIAKGELRHVPCIGQQLDGVRIYIYIYIYIYFVLFHLSNKMYCKYDIADKKNFFCFYIVVKYYTSL
jgi:hypothetical protein